MIIIDLIGAAITVAVPFYFFRHYPWVNGFDEVQPGWLIQAYFVFYFWRIFHPIILAGSIWLSMALFGVVDVTDLSAPTRLLPSFLSEYTTGAYKLIISTVLLCISYFGLELLGKSILSLKADYSINNWRRFGSYRWRRIKTVTSQTILEFVFSITSLLSISIIAS